MTARTNGGVRARRTPVKTPQVEAATFDFDHFLGDFRRPNITRSLIQRADLGPVLAQKQRILDDLDEQIDRLERAEGDDGQERDITAVNPLVTLSERRNRLTHEYNELAQVYNDSAVEFTFRPPDGKGDQTAIQELMEATGLQQPDEPDVSGLSEDEAAEVRKEYETGLEQWFAALAIRSMSVTCVEWPGTAQGAPPMTVPQWEALRERVGAVAFNTLASAWFEAVQASAPAVPFSLRPLPTPEPVAP